MRLFVPNSTAQRVSSLVFPINAAESVQDMTSVATTNVTQTQPAETSRINTCVTARKVSGEMENKFVQTLTNVFVRECLTVIIVVVIPAVSTLLGHITVNVWRDSNRQALLQKQHPVSVSNSD
jgi:hypothetical protein